MLPSEWIHPNVGFTLDYSRKELDYTFTVLGQSIHPKAILVRSRIIGKGQINDQFFECLDLMCPRNDPPDYQAKYNCNALFNGSILLNIGSFFNHSCSPNCAYSLDTVTEEVFFTAVKEIELNQELTISYWSFPIDCNQIRRSLCRQRGFQCHCDTCIKNLAPSCTLLDFQEMPRTLHCWWCGQPAKLTCGQCGQAQFCSEECRRCDAPIHRKICKLLKTKFK